MRGKKAAGAVLGGLAALVLGVGAAAAAADDIRGSGSPMCGVEATMPPERAEATMPPEVAPVTMPPEQADNREI
jgi:hypothetical protein